MNQGNWKIPEHINLDEIQNFKIYPDDVFIVTQPKCGTTWMQELSWLIANNLDLEGAKLNQFFRVPFLELQFVGLPGRIRYSTQQEPGSQQQKQLENYPDDQPMSEETVLWYMMHSMEYAKRLKRPRIIKSHLPLSFLPSDLINKCKVIYVARNIKDATVSYFHHEKILSGTSMDFKTFASSVRNNDARYSPFIPHILEAWKQKDNENLFFTTYEDMKRDLRKVSSDLVCFLEKKDANIDMDTLLSQVDVEAFRNNKYVNKDKEIPGDESGNTFIRKGITGDWKNYFDCDMSKDWDPWIEKQLAGSGFKMQFE